MKNWKKSLIEEAILGQSEKLTKHIGENLEIWNEEKIWKWCEKSQKTYLNCIFGIRR